jgi:hypothetical protein
MTQPLSDTDTNVLKPCPFCAGKAAMRHWEWPYERYQVRCSVCKALPSPGRFNTAEKAIAAWNTRPEQQNTDINAVTAEMLEAAWKSVNPPRLVNLDNKDLTAIYLAMSSASHPTKAPSPVAGDVVELIRARAKQRPSDGLIARQGVDETAIRYGQALLLALADEIEETIDRCAMCGCLLASKWTGDDEPHCPGCLAALEAIPSVDAGELEPTGADFEAIAGLLEHAQQFNPPACYVAAHLFEPLRRVIETAKAAASLQSRIRMLEDLAGCAALELRDSAKAAIARGSPLTAEARTDLADEIDAALNKGASHE